MSIKKSLLLVGMLVIIAAFAAACAGPEGPVGPAGPQGPAGPMPSTSDLTCTQCHNDSSALVGKVYAWEESRHSTAGTAWIEERGNQTCATCHSGASFVDAMTQGLTWKTYGTAEGIILPDATPQDCRTCHNIHSTYTADDFSLRTIAPVTMVISGQTFDKGMGNLCVNCHQARKSMADFPAKDAAGAVIAGKIDISTRFNPHLSNQSDMLLGVGGGGTVTGSPSTHYTMTTDSCVTCHLGTTADHTFAASISTCQVCHAEAKDFDINDAVSAIQSKFDTLEAALINAGSLKKTEFDGVMDLTELPDGTWAYQNTNDTYYTVSVVATKGVDEAAAFPVWVYGYIMEDGSMGVHNPSYADALLDAALASLGK